MTKTAVDLEIETLGLRCPLPVLRVKKRIQPLHSGSRVRVIADDPTTQRDLPAWCALAGHRIVSTQTLVNPTRYVYDILLDGAVSEGER